MNTTKSKNNFEDKTQELDKLAEELAGSAEQCRNLKTELQTVNNKYQRIFENIQDIYYEILLDGTILEVSPSIELSSQYTREEIIGKSVHEIYFDARQRTDFIDAITKNGKVHDYGLTLKNRDGNPIFASISSKLVADEHGVPHKIVGILRDISDRKKAEESLSVAYELMEQKVQERTAELYLKNDDLKREVKERRSAERRFRDIAELLPQLYFETDIDGNATWVSHKAFSLFGYSQEDLSKGFSALNAVIPEDRDRCSNNFRRSLHGEDLSGSTYTALRKDGSRFPVIVYSNPIIVDGSPVGTRGIIVDITAHKKIEDALIESERKYRDLYENANDIIYIIDFNGRIVSCNTAALRIFGYSSQEETGISINQIIDPQYLLSVKARMNERIQGKIDIAHYEVLAHAKDGKTVWLELSTRTIMEKGVPVAIQGIARDVTERKQAEEILKKREKELEEKTQNLEEMNSALKVLLKRRDDDKKELEERYLGNIKELILPYIEKLKLETLNSSSQTYLSVIESNMADLLSPFMQKLTAKYPHLTSREVKIANLIKDGRTTKEIAGIMKVSKKAIDFHRDSIRNKLGLKHARINLTSYLNSNTK